MPITPSTYYARKQRPPSDRHRRDAELLPVLEEHYTVHRQVYGARKMHAQLRRHGHPVARFTSERLMRTNGLRGLRRGRMPNTTVASSAPETRPHLVDQNFAAAAPNQLWVADIRTFAGWTYAAFVLDAFSRMVVGWQVSTSLRTDLAPDALKMGIWNPT